jgi:hypothetical protein
LPDRIGQRHPVFARQHMQRGLSAFPQIIMTSLIVTGHF